ncbi:AAA family [Fusarium pseudocircinatum]|uniref:AAA family n=1 Tax=Fusarium pseudocircinatum TaxID=56676 RepID=A0A8H5P767_9HYPO|nr:AAA family [Fusarium pseudocircinatum]
MGLMVLGMAQQVVSTNRRGLVLTLVNPVDDFKGHLPLTSLPFYPSQLHPDFDNLQKELIKRGKEFREICEADQSSRLYDYKGKTIFERKGLSDRVNDDGRVFDREILGLYFPRSRPDSRYTVASDETSQSSENPGLIKRYRTNFDDDDNSTKKLLLDLVNSHTSTNPGLDEEDENALDVDDIIPDKGKGLIIFLYGPPGVGKTSTAETIAMVTGKALFSVCKPWLRASKSPLTILKIKVFLRALEYYQGIMFLTANQIAEFDVAIPSRIHLAIKYESLQRTQMEAIFDSFLKDLDERNLIEDYADIKDWLDDSVYKGELDGRQIRNMVTTALGLARAESRSGGGQKLNKRHLKRAFGNISDFKRDFNTQM